MWYVGELYSAIESNDAQRIWRLFETLSETDAVAAATNLGPVRIRELLYRFVRQSKSANNPSASFVTQPRVVSVGLMTPMQRTEPVVLLPVVLQLAFKDRTFLASATDAALSSRVQACLQRLNAERAARPLIRLSRDVTHTLLTPFACQAGLTDTQFQESATRLGVDVAAIKTIALAESGGRVAFDKQDRAFILLEAHKFREFTNKQFDLTHPHLSCVGEATVRKYYSWDQYNRLYEALVLDKVAAIKACSWGKFQVMGFNHNGSPDPISFARAMQVSETNQLKAFEEYCIKAGIIKHLKNKDWANVALLYNGKNYKTNKYDTKLEAAYKRYGGK